MVVAVGLLGCGLASGPASEAAYPGGNGSIAFNVEGRSGTWSETVRPDGRGRRRLGDFKSVSWSGSGRRLVALDYSSGGSPLVRADRVGRTLGTIPLPDSVPCDWGGCSPLEPNVRLYVADEGLALSPDGRTLAFVNDFDLPNMGLARWIWTVRTDGSRLRRLRAGTEPRWTPDGRRIVFQSWDELGSIEEVASMRRDGTDFRRVRTVTPFDELLDVSSDGRRVLWWGGEPRKRPSRNGLYTSELRGRDAHLIDRSLYAYDGCWSADGTKIVFSRLGPREATWVIPAAGGRKRRVLARPHEGLAWQPRRLRR